MVVAVNQACFASLQLFIDIGNLLFQLLHIPRLTLGVEPLIFLNRLAQPVGIDFQSIAVIDHRRGQIRISPRRRPGRQHQAHRPHQQRLRRRQQAVHRQQPHRRTRHRHLRRRQHTDKGNSTRRCRAESQSIDMFTRRQQHLRQRAARSRRLVRLTGKLRQTVVERLERLSHRRLRLGKVRVHRIGDPQQRLRHRLRRQLAVRRHRPQLAARHTQPARHRVHHRWRVFRHRIELVAAQHPRSQRLPELHHRRLRRPRRRARQSHRFAHRLRRTRHLLLRQLQTLRVLRETLVHLHRTFPRRARPLRDTERLLRCRIQTLLRIRHQPQTVLQIGITVRPNHQSLRRLPGQIARRQPLHRLRHRIQPP